MLCIIKTIADYYNKRHLGQTWLLHIEYDRLVASQGHMDKAP